MEEVVLELTVHDLDARQLKTMTDELNHMVGVDITPVYSSTTLGFGDFVLSVLSGVASNAIWFLAGYVAARAGRGELRGPRGGPRIEIGEQGLSKTEIEELLRALRQHHEEVVQHVAELGEHDPPAST